MSVENFLLLKSHELYNMATNLCSAKTPLFHRSKNYTDSLGRIVLHNGSVHSSKRVGWVGVVVDSDIDEDTVTVFWILDKHYEPLKDTRGHIKEEDKAPLNFGIVQKYTRNWYDQNILFGKGIMYNLETYTRYLLLSNSGLTLSGYSGRFNHKSEFGVICEGQLIKNFNDKESALMAAEMKAKNSKSNCSIVEVVGGVDVEITTKVKEL